MENIRLVIWDLDDTFWKGTLSEGEVIIPKEHRELIYALTDRGIINSICSKNDEAEVRKILEKEGLWEYFVFPSISWGAKGPAVKDIVGNVKLRPQTVLFIDDNPTNLAEVKFSVPGIETADPSIIDKIIDSPIFKGKDDKLHTRLNQYKILEVKHKDEKKYKSNEEFLLNSNIKVELHRDNVLDELPRLHELNQRSNQLNYTKKRLSIEEMKELILNPKMDKGYITVKDDYGDYGITGFFACSNGRLEQFFFSCRTLGLGVEQWVYSQLCYPEIDVKGTVATELIRDKVPSWINTSSANNETSNREISGFRMLVIGGCDLEQTAFYLEQTGIPFETQFNYVVNGLYDGHPDCSVIIRQSLELPNKLKLRTVEDCDFYDDEAFNIKIFGDYDVVVYSPIIDMAIGLWENKNDSSLKVVYGNRDYSDLTDNGYLSSSKLMAFKEKYRYLGGITPEIFRDNLVFIRRMLPAKTKLIILNGGEIDIKHPYEPNRFIVHKKMNAVIDEFCQEDSNVYLIDIRKIATSDDDFTDNIRHYTRQVYYEVAKQIIEYLSKFGLIKDIESIIINKKQKMNIRVEMKKILRKLGLLDLAYKIRDQKGARK